MKNRIKLVVVFLLGAIIFGSIGVYATAKYLSKDISYTKQDGTVTNVDAAITELYNRSSDCVIGVYHHIPNTQWNIEIGFVPSIVNIQYDNTVTQTYYTYNKYHSNLSMAVGNTKSNNTKSVASAVPATVRIDSNIISEFTTASAGYKNTYDVYYQACK